MKLTPNYGLEIIEGTDIVDPDLSLNKNINKIDGLLKKANKQIYVSNVKPTDDELDEGGFWLQI